MSRRHALAGLGILVVLVAIAALAPDNRAVAQDGYQSGIAVTLRTATNRVVMGRTLALRLEVTNVGTQSLNLTLDCDPPVDFRIYAKDGSLVWRLHPTCTDATVPLALAAGATRHWVATWTAADSTGAPLPVADYTVYGILRTVPEHAVAGPVVFEAVNGEAEHTAVPEHTRVPGDVTATPHHEATRVPEHTRVPGDVTATPHAEATHVPEHTAVPAESGEPFYVTDREGRQSRPDVAGHPELGDCQNLVVWWDEPARQIWGRFVERQWRSEPFLVSGDMSATGPPKVAYSIPRHQWLVVWADVTDGAQRVIRGRYIKCAAVQEAVFTIGGEVAGDDQPAVAATGEQFAVVWRHTVGDTGSQIMGAHVVGTQTQQLKAISDAGIVSEPAIACEGRGECLVAWTWEHSGDRDVVGRYWFPRESYVGTRLLEIAVTDRIERYPSIAWNGWYDRGAYAVTWADEAGDSSVIRVRTVYPGTGDRLDGYVLGEPVLLVSGENHRSDHADVAALGPGFVAVWSTGATVPAEIVARRLGYDPNTRGLSLGPVTAVGSHDAVEDYPAVPSSLDPLTLVVWQIDRGADASDVLGRHVAVPALAGGQVALLGALRSVPGGSGSLLQAGAATWNVQVLKVREGEFECGQALVRFSRAAPAIPALMMGDLVFVRGNVSPADGACTVTVGAAGTSVSRATIGRLVLPFSWN